MPLSGPAQARSHAHPVRPMHTGSSHTPRPRDGCRPLAPLLLPPLPAHAGFAWPQPCSLRVLPARPLAVSSRLASSVSPARSWRTVTSGTHTALLLGRPSRSGHARRGGDTHGSRVSPGHGGRPATHAGTVGPTTCSSSTHSPASGPRGAHGRQPARQPHPFLSPQRRRPREAGRGGCRAP